MKRVLIVTELFYPEETSTAYILTKIANKLSNKYEVCVICGPESYNKSEQRTTNYCNIKDSIQIKRVAGVSLDKNKILSRLARIAVISFRLFYEVWRNLKKGDILLVVTNPAPLLLLIAMLKSMDNVFCILVHDVYPENMIPARIYSSSKSTMYKLTKLIFDWAYRKADTLIVLGRDMEKIMRGKLGKNKRQTQIRIIENWAETESISLLREKPRNVDLTPKIDIQYAGNLGRVQGLMNLLAIIRNTRNKCLRFSFWGDGAIKKEMMAFVADNHLDDIFFYGGYKREEQNEILNSCNIAIVTLAEGMYGLGVPSKSYNIMAAGKPILYIGDLQSEIALVVKEHQIGYCFDAKDVEGISDFFLSLNLDRVEELKGMGEKARAIAESKYSEEIILNKFFDVL